MSDRQRPAPHPVDRARLTQFAPLAPPVHRYEPADRHTNLVRHYWVPVWDLPAGKTVTEYVLQYPSCLVVVSNSYARFYGVVTGRSHVSLTGQGWAVGIMLRPGAGPSVFGSSDLSHLSDTYVDVELVPSMAHGVGAVRSAMASDPQSPRSHESAIAVLETLLDAVPDVSSQGRDVSRWVSLVESDPDLCTVAELTQVAGASERRMQRVLRRYLGLTPKWLIQRRRLHEALDRLKHNDTPLADLAVGLGYADQAHFSRDFRKVTGYSPGEFARHQASARDRAT
ncbi:MAG: helix-turn-helix domain-containing protein [Ornithinimicrobium sp.]